MPHTSELKLGLYYLGPLILAFGRGTPNQAAFRKLLHACMDPAHAEHQAAWETFDRRYRSAILQPILTVTKRPYDVEEIVAQVLMRLVDNNFSALRQFRGENEVTFRAYLAKISRFTALAHVMKNTLQTEELQEWGTAGGGAMHAHLVHLYLVDFLRTVQTGTQKAAYHRERDTLVFLLRKLAGFRAKEVAAIPILSLNDHNVDVVVNRLTQRLSSELQRWLSTA